MRSHFELVTAADTVAWREAAAAGRSENTRVRQTTRPAPNEVGVSTLYADHALQLRQGKSERVPHDCSRGA